MSTRESTNPYLANQRAHNDRYLSLSTSKWNWQLVCGGLLLTTVISNIGTVYVSQQQKVVPYIVGPATAGSEIVVRDLIATSVRDPRVISLQLADFILKIRQLSTDAKVMGDNSEHAFAMCLSPAQTYIRGYYKDFPPAETLKRGPVYPENIVVTPRTEKSWVATWDEEQQDVEGLRIGAKRWEATIEIVLIMPTTKSERDSAPLGVWVERVSWSERS